MHPSGFHISGSPFLSRHSLRLLDEAVAIEREDAKKARKICYMARSMVQASMPYRDPLVLHYERRNGNFRLVMIAPPGIGLPFGNVPRLLLCWLTTEVVRTKERTLFLGDNLTDFMQQVGLETIRGGRTGSITRLKEQSRRLFSCSIGYHYENKEYSAGKNLFVADQFQLWRDSKVTSDLPSLRKSHVTLSEIFYNEVMCSPVPLDLRAIKALKSHPMALDIYCWLVHRMSYLSRVQPVPWEALMMQFGSDYERTRDFKRYFVVALRKALTVYSAANVETTDTGLKLKPSRRHIAARG